MKIILITFSALLFLWAGILYAAETISVTVKVEKNWAKTMRIFGTGFSVNKKNSGSIGSETTKTGPKGGKYSFGFRIAGSDVSCGTAVLNQDSTVILYLDKKNNKCLNRVIPNKN